MTTRDDLPGASCSLLGLRIMCFYGNTINAEKMCYKSELCKLFMFIIVVMLFSLRLEVI